MIDQLLAEISALGWRFNNCYQTHADLWRVNLRRPSTHGDWFTDWAEAATLEDALFDCMAKLSTAEFFHTPEIRGSIDNSPEPSLLSRLKLPTARSLPPLERRI